MAEEYIRLYNGFKLGFTQIIKGTISGENFLFVSKGAANNIRIK